MVISHWGIHLYVYVCYIYIYIYRNINIKWRNSIIVSNIDCQMSIFDILTSKKDYLKNCSKNLKGSVLGLFHFFFFNTVFGCKSKGWLTVDLELWWSDVTLAGGWERGLKSLTSRSTTSSALCETRKKKKEGEEAIYILYQSCSTMC